MPAKNPKSEYVTVRVSKEQGKLVRKAAEAEGRSVMNWTWRVISKELEQLQASGALK